MRQDFLTNAYPLAIRGEGGGNGGGARERGRGCRDREVAKVVLKRVVRRGRRRAKKTP